MSDLVVHSPLWFLAIAFFCAFTSQSLTGFGAGIIALTIGAQMFPLVVLVPQVVALSTMLSLYMAFRYRAQIARQLLIRRIVPFGGLGLAIGYSLTHVLEREVLRTSLGVVVVAIAAYGLYEAWHRHPSKGPDEVADLGVATSAFLAVGGVVHGLLATGGPLLAAGIHRAVTDKGAFRTTFAVVWIMLNGSLVSAFAVEGRYDAKTLTTLLCMLPVLVLATVVGEWGHRRIPERAFRILLMALLLVAGGALVLE